MTPIEREVWCALARIHDPEMPLLSIIDLGIIDEVRVESERCRVEYTPTVTSCPAARMMAREIERTVREVGLEADVRRRYSPPWTRSRMTAEGERKLRSIGISVTEVPAADEKPESRLRVLQEMAVECPHCGSFETRLENPFGGTCCRALRYCESCRQPFQHFRLA